MRKIAKLFLQSFQVSLFTVFLLFSVAIAPCTTYAYCIHDSLGSYRIP